MSRSILLFLVAICFIISGSGCGLKICPDCHGKSYCSRCGGDGKCNVCAGVGNIYDESAADFIECPECEGDKDCTKCDGNGICPTCKGLGKISPWGKWREDIYENLLF